VNGSAPAPAPTRASLGLRVETVLLAVTLGSMIVLAAAQIVLRNFWGTGIGWADEALRVMVLWVTMMGAVAASREQRHVSIDALSRYLPHRAQRVSAVLVNALTSAVCMALTWYSGLFVIDSLDAGDRILGDVPAWIAQAILPVGFALIAYRYVAATVQAVMELTRGGQRA
jgi:TRAP-type C4-dicarboxylate transport system permease small subunit